MTRILIAWVFTAYTLLYQTGGPVPNLANPLTFSFATQAKCEDQRLAHTRAEDSQGRLALQVSEACVEVP